MCKLLLVSLHLFHKYFGCSEWCGGAKLTFTRGTSVTTGATINMRSTITCPTIQYNGYPDPASLDKVVAEMAAQGVEEGIVRGRSLVVVMTTYITIINISEVLMFNAKR